MFQGRTGSYLADTPPTGHGYTPAEAAGRVVRDRDTGVELPLTVRLHEEGAAVKEQ